MAKLRTNNFFTKSLDWARGNVVDKSIDWFKYKSKNLGKGMPNTQEKILKMESDRMSSGPEVGRMYFYRYDPKWKKELPYYDTFPLIFCVKNIRGGFYGINFHYLPPLARAKLMDALYSITSDERMDKKTKLRISYEILKSTSKFKEFVPCFKRYLYSHLKSNLVEIYSDEWEVALFLPVAKFEKASKSKVYSDSRKIIRNL